MRPQSQSFLVSIRITAILLCCCICCPGTGCGGDSSSPHLTLLQVSPSPYEVALGNTGQLKAMGKFSDGKERDLTTIVVWQLAGPSVASVSPLGIVKPLAVGQAMVRATYGTVVASTTVKVDAAELASIEITPSTTTLPLGRNVQLKAIGHNADNSTADLTGSVSWSSSNPAIAALAQDGQATSKAIGVVNVAATEGTVKGSATLSITAPALVSITATADSPSLAVGQKTQMRAHGTFTDNSSQEITDTVTWSSSAPQVIGVDSNGVAQASAVGATSITASVSTIRGSKGMTATAAALESITVSSDEYVLAVGTNRPTNCDGELQ